MNFKKIVIDKPYQQFENIDIEFHSRLTVLTGANGSGKTTILNLLAKHFGWDSVQLSMPRRNKSLGGWIWNLANYDSNESPTSMQIGFIEYSSGQTANLVVPLDNSPQYQIQIQGQQSLNCFFIPSHRQNFRYQHVDNIPTSTPIDKTTAFHNVWNSIKNRYFGGADQSSSYYMKQALITWSLFGRGNEEIEPDPNLLKYYKGFEDILKIVLPKELGFKKFIIRNFEIILQCKSGDFIIDAASGGLSAIIDMAWQIYMKSTIDRNSEVTVVIDEVENHLHPTLQRRILSDFLKAFPNVKFIVSTHSPLIVGSVKDSYVYILKTNNNKKIKSIKIDLVNEARTATEILDEVLGVSFTMPLWAEDELTRIIDKYSSGEISDTRLDEMRKELELAGLERLFPNALGEIV